MAVPGSGAGILYNALKDLLGWFRRRFHKLTPEERLVRRDKWKERFREEIWRTESEELRQDVIIRDVRRLDHYPDGPEQKGISSWFRVALMGQYHRGIQLGLSIHSLMFEEAEGPEGAWRLADNSEHSVATKAYLIGFVRYDNIESVDWHGDEYYNYPHIFCHFSHRGEPYERLVFCTQGSVLPKHYFYSELASHEQVRLTSQKYGTAKSYWNDS